MATIPHRILQGLPGGKGRGKAEFGFGFLAAGHETIAGVIQESTIAFNARNITSLR